ncbi:hypothetical protein OXPF_31020 [Oxobacter pfennigii]|uniref:DUF4825 domain-containing protein n=1 Tax=Oxobacter pfennigii TaxID=36849 RepID=A0A0P8W6K9_9CLOT|nr:hypothetical protein [Oxobacter pfennigii]KPU43660.1 hypothetical protein OXPF_31020 [Oxobacter pfennigii]
MKKRLIIALSTILALVLLVASVAYADSVSYGWPEEEPNNTVDETRGVWDFTEHGEVQNIFGVVSSADTIDLARVSASTIGGVFTFELYPDPNVDVDMYICDEDGNVIYQAYEQNGVKKITNFYAPKEPWLDYFIKVVYNSGVPSIPYTLKMRLDGFSPSMANDIINKQDLPLDIQKQLE